MYPVDLPNEPFIINNVTMKQTDFTGFYIFVLVLWITSVLSSFYVIISMYKIGITNSSTYLIAILNVTVVIRNICLAPFIFAISHYTCLGVGAVAIWALFCALLTIYFMMINLNDAIFQTARSDHFSKYSKRYIFGLPVIIVIYPLARDALDPADVWCILNNTEVFCVLEGVVWCIITATIIEIRHFIQNFLNLSPDFYEQTKLKLIKGPGVYAITCIVFTIIINIAHTASLFINTLPIAEAIIVCFSYLIGIVFAFVFMKQKLYIEVPPVTFTTRVYICIASRTNFVY
jgi:hypothetical protein